MNVLMAGLSHLDERQLAATELKDETTVLVRLITNEAALDTVEMKPREQDIYAMVDGKKTIAEIVHLSQLDPLETKRICYTLRKVGLLRVREG